MNDKYLRIILENMFERVGQKFENKAILEEQWYLKHSWTEEQQNEFIEWLGKFLYKNTEARHEIMTFKGRSKKMCDRAAREFTFNYGWKQK